MRAGRHAPGYVARGKFADPWKIPFREMIPLKLRTSVSARGDNRNGAFCVQEMSVLLACMKKNEFEERHCSTQLTSFQKCVSETEAALKQKKAAARRGDLAPGEKKLSHHQVTGLLKKYPG
ncbi:unnamed protein product [Nesidiocoris tenuis]|uniref:Uncharacterized protein n=2 Tax=Nesidiocoris tenuis TaxID=355587 RepID=A0A6H5HQ56_9HEMI|nr:coiled-coil-helix-coiled-coil-helix domain containing 1 [Nesidiocoris tenuis]CAB0019033.1 unnamed protein product [Nesidiocoris tenuis]